MNNTPIYDRIERSLTERKSQSMFRSVKTYTGRQSIDLSTNSYLALHSIPEITEEAERLAVKRPLNPPQGDLIKNECLISPPAGDLEGALSRASLCGNLASRLVAEHP